jgi:cytochrome d ubiquinol oxidase subunit I
VRETTVRGVTNLLFARAQMGLSLAFHIAFAAAGVALPLLMVLADIKYLRTRDPEYLALSKRMAKGTAILFAVGAVSGTVLSFELGLLWPRFMGTFGEVIGLPFALEGFAFFTEAIFLGIYLYGRGRVSERFHLFSGIAVAVSGAASAFFVTLVNAAMNLPAGFRMENGKPVDVDPIAAMFSPSWAHQVVHVLLSSYQSTAFLMAGIHALFLLKDSKSTFHRKAFGIALWVACITALLQPISGDLSAAGVAKEQPWKLAAMEAQFQTEAGAPLRLGGLPDVERRTVSYALEIPYGLSLLAFKDPKAVVKGLEEFPRDEWPPVTGVHLSFQVMVGAGTLMALLSAFTALLAWRRKRVPDGRWLLRGWVVAGPLGLVAMEAGWLVTELGRQPWIMHGAMRTSEAVTPFQPVSAPFWLFTGVYLFLGVASAYLLYRQILSKPYTGEADAHGH